MRDDARLPLRHHANAGLMAHFTSRPARRIAPARHLDSGPPDAVVDAYHQLGSHPDCVTRIWEALDAGLPARCRWIVHDTPVLAHPLTGVIFAFAGGTTYALRLVRGDLEAALRAGAEQVHHFPAYPALGIGASTLDLRAIGPDWIFGAWRREEQAWCENAFQAAAAGWPAVG